MRFGLAFERMVWNSFMILNAIIIYVFWIGYSLDFRVVFTEILY